VPLETLDWAATLIAWPSPFKDYSEYSEFMRDIKEYPSVNIDETKSFINDLQEKNQFQPLSFYLLAGYLAKQREMRIPNKSRV
jgi:uncharacterized protein YydD (DUF2326 family)